MANQSGDAPFGNQPADLQQVENVILVTFSRSHLSFRGLDWYGILQDTDCNKSNPTRFFANPLLKIDMGVQTGIDFPARAIHLLTHFLGF